MYNLTERELQVIRELYTGGTSSMIGERLHVSPHTVDSHISRVLLKLEVQTRRDAVVKALKEGILS